MRRLIRFMRLAVCFITILSLLPVYGTAVSENASEWKTVISSNNFRDSAYNGKDQYVVVGIFGDIRTSAGGNSWIKQNSGTSSSLLSVIWDGKKYIAVGSKGTILTSQDGVAWTAQISNTTMELQSVIFDGRQYIAVGWGYIKKEKPYTTLHSVILRSDDAISWNVLPADPKFVLNDIVTNGKVYLISSDEGKFLQSENGIDWSILDTGINSSWIIDTVWNGNKFVAVGLDGLIMISTDGYSWKKIYIADQAAFVSIIWDGRKFIALDEHGALAISTDGTTWDFQSIKIKNTLTRINFTGSKYLITGFGETILISEDLKNWTDIYGITKYTFWGAATNNNIFVMVGAKGTILTSKDGYQWTEQTTSTTDTLRDVIWDGRQFIAIGDAGTFLTSKDGITWDKKVYSEILYPQKIIWSGTQYVIVGRGALILTSPDGNIWTKQAWSDHEKSQLMSIAWNGEKFVAVGMYGNIITSHDGVSWKKQNSNTENSLQDVVWSGSHFVAVGDWNTIAVSKDGIEWTTTADKKGFSLNKIIWNGKYYIATSYKKIIRSADAQNWTEVSINNNDLYLAGAWNGYSYILGGRFGTVMMSTPLDLIKVTVNGVPIPFDVAPTSVNDRTLVPLRYIFNALNADVKWDEETQTVTARKGNTTLILQIGCDQANVNGATIKMDVPATEVNGRTMVPVRFIAESFNCNVTWNEGTQTVIIHT